MATLKSKNDIEREEQINKLNDQIEKLKLEVRMLEIKGELALLEENKGHIVKRKMRIAFNNNKS